jgi:high-affinity nickel permease
LQGFAKDAGTRRAELLLAAKRLALELRGLDLLADHVKAVDGLTRKLQVQVQEVIAARAH